MKSYLDNCESFIGAPINSLLHLSVSPSSIDRESRPNKHDNLSFIYPFPCDSGSLKWQGFGYDLHLEWLSISHRCHPQIRQWLEK